MCFFFCRRLGSDGIREWDEESWTRMEGGTKQEIQAADASGLEDEDLETFGPTWRLSL